jgi:hypothetical protein
MCTETHQRIVTFLVRNVHRVEPMATRSPLRITPACDSYRKQFGIQRRARNRRGTICH